MTAAADSTATVVSPAECEADGEGSQSGHLPVFAAFDDLGLTGRDIAELAHVTPPTVSKWRSAKVRIPGERLAFLTLVLAHILDEADTHMPVAPHGLENDLELNAALRDKCAPYQGALESAHAHLAYQNVLNGDLPPTEVRQGAQKFRVWWTSGEAEKLQQRRFTPRTDADILDVLKKLRTMS